MYLRYSQVNVISARWLRLACLYPLPIHIIDYIKINQLRGDTHCCALSFVNAETILEPNLYIHNGNILHFFVIMAWNSWVFFYKYINKRILSTRNFYNAIDFCVCFRGQLHIESSYAIVSDEWKFGEALTHYLRQSMFSGWKMVLDSASINY